MAPISASPAAWELRGQTAIVAGEFHAVVPHEHLGNSCSVRARLREAAESYIAEWTAEINQAEQGIEQRDRANAAMEKKAAAEYRAGQRGQLGCSCSCNVSCCMGRLTILLL